MKADLRLEPAAAVQPGHQRRRHEVLLGAEAVELPLRQRLPFPGYGDRRPVPRHQSPRLSRRSLQARSLLLLRRRCDVWRRIGGSGCIGDAGEGAIVPAGSSGSAAATDAVEQAGDRRNRGRGVAAGVEASQPLRRAGPHVADEQGRAARRRLVLARDSLSSGR
ncbi:hypothetical protein AXF42_Ash005508 [Apostasia shenzhenica]|uniref:Uncharacterized protein n=1 Tax=Apostasia shenzhenica TaxID=1088818 RepID=A0A2I0B737_9ASPA|nr:hypothetical protein AXF42_Ash005508 [Apostasia shenzhenica]